MLRAAFTENCSGNNLTVYVYDLAETTCDKVSVCIHLAYVGSNFTTVARNIKSR